MAWRRAKQAKQKDPPLRALDTSELIPARQGRRRALPAREALAQGTDTLRAGQPLTLTHNAWAAARAILTG